MLDWRSYAVGTCHGMSPKAMLMRGVASADMPWHVPAAMNALLQFVTLRCKTARIWASDIPLIRQLPLSGGKLL